MYIYIYIYIYISKTFGIQLLKGNATKKVVLFVVEMNCQVSDMNKEE